jgi:hypothetical protein
MLNKARGGTARERGQGKGRQGKERDGKVRDGKQR